MSAYYILRAKQTYMFGITGCETGHCKLKWKVNESAIIQSAFENRLGAGLV